MAEKTRRADPTTLNGDVTNTGAAMRGPSLRRFDSDQTMTGSAVPDYPSKKADASKGGRELENSQVTVITLKKGKAVEPSDYIFDFEQVKAAWGET